MYNHEQFMRRAIELARQSSIIEKAGGPFGCVIVKNGKVVGEGANRVIAEGDPTSHAEINAIKAACKKLGTYELSDCTVYTTGEPCPMCYGACCWARVDAIYYASTTQDAYSFGGFDDASMYDALNIPIEQRTLTGTELLRDEMLTLWSEFKSLPTKVHY
jgi:tRNA(Arg) A34 adenosine deaminase TadA